MTKGTLAYHFVARHGYAIERLKRDMAAEETSGHLVDFLAYEAANFVYGFLLASGNRVSPDDRALRDEVERAVLATLAKYGIDNDTFVVWPEIDRGMPPGERALMVTV